VSVVTAVLVGIIVWQAWPTVVAAARSLGRVDLIVFALLVPVQLASFAATGEVLFSFLRGRGELRGMHPLTAMRMSLEFNFANHMLPSGGAAGIAYTAWKLNTLGVPASKATLAQLARFAVTFVSFSVMLAVAGGWLIVSGTGTQGVLWTAALIGVLAVGGTAAGVVLLRRRRMLHRLAGLLTRAARWATRIIRRPREIDPVPLVRFVDGIHLEVREVTGRGRTLFVPFLWSFLVNAFDAGLFWIALAAFGMRPDPALVFVAYGVATVASMVIVTPNGVGAYEVVMVGTLVAGGLPAETTIAAIVLARAVLLLGTIAFGWGFYQHSVATAAAPALTRAAR
jgi:uncharacterized protein (TIRG00374 family)